MRYRKTGHGPPLTVDPAVLEVNGLGEFGCKVEPVYTGRKVTAVCLSWWAKNLDERKHALNELRYSRVGRCARLKGEVVTAFPAYGQISRPSQEVTDSPFAGVAIRRVSEEIQGDEPSQFVTDKPIPIRDRQSPKALPSVGQSGLTEKQFASFRRDFQGFDIPWLEREFREWVADRDPPGDYAAAFYGFMKRKRDDAR